jgi:predicted esterase
LREQRFILNHRSVTTRQNLIWGGLFILLFLGALGWARERDPFVRKWFTLKTSDRASVKCVAVLPKPMRRYPVVIYAHGAGEDLLKDGVGLRQMAELGLASVGFEYNKTNEMAFDAQFAELLRHLNQQSWVNTNAIAWVGLSQGANSMLDFALQHPEQQPQLLIQLSGAGVEKSAGKSKIPDTNSTPSTLPPSLRYGAASNSQPPAAPKRSDGGSTNFHCPVLLVHGEGDEVFPVADIKRLGSTLQTRGVQVEIKTIPGLPHGLEPERGVIFRAVSEYCLTHLAGKDAWQNYRSIAQWQAKALPLWLWWLPAVIWAGGWWTWSVKSRAKTQPVKTPLSRGEIVLRWLAVLLAIGALSVTALYLVTPLFTVSDTTTAIAGRFLVQPKERAGFEYLVTQPIWRGQKLKTLLEHVRLAGYNRELVNWQVDDKIYRDYVLSPVITGNPDEQLNWRRSLWEEFYPRIRHENSTEDAAKIIVRHLRERVTIAAAPNLPQDVPAIWLKQVTDETGFEIIYVAALRSVGVPARLGSHQQAEFWNGDKWQTAPMPSVMSW